MSSELGNFTPVSHALAQEVGLVSAAVYGAVWRHCQMEEGVCRASLNKLGKDLGIDRATVMRSIEKLCNLGYLMDQTPGRRNAPHTYILKKTVAGCNSLSNATVAESNATVAESNATVAESNATVAESYLKRDIEETPLRDNKRIAKKLVIASPEQNKLFLSLSRLCHINLKVASEKQIGQLDQATKALFKEPINVNHFEEKFGIYWATVDWRGKQGQPPIPAQIREVYGDYCHWLSNGEQKVRQNGTDKRSDGPLQRTGQEVEGEPTYDPTTRELVYPDGRRIPYS